MDAHGLSPVSVPSNDAVFGGNKGGGSGKGTRPAREAASGGGVQPIQYVPESRGSAGQASNEAEIMPHFFLALS